MTTQKARHSGCPSYVLITSLAFRPILQRLPTEHLLPNDSELKDMQSVCSSTHVLQSIPFAQTKTTLISLACKAARRSQTQMVALVSATTITRIVTHARNKISMHLHGRHWQVLRRGQGSHSRLVGTWYVRSLQVNTICGM
jgi:hypothetical protein